MNQPFTPKEFSTVPVFQKKNIYFFRLTPGLEDVSKYPDLFAALIDDGSWSDADLAKLASGNVIRVFSEVEEASEALKKEEDERQNWIPLKDLEAHGDNATKCSSDYAERMKDAARAAMNRRRPAW